MIKKDIIFEIEKKLYNYFNWEDIKKGSNEKITLLNEQIDELHKQIDEINEALNIDATNIISPLRANLIKEIEIKMLEKYEEERIQRAIEIDNKSIKNKMLNIDPEKIKFMELKYKSKLRNFEIASEMNMSESTVTRIKKEILKEAAQWQSKIEFITQSS